MVRLLLSLILFLPVSGFAHAGHSHVDGNTVLHYFAAPEHALPLAAILVFTVWLLFRRYRKGATQKS